MAIEGWKQFSARQKAGHSTDFWPVLPYGNVTLDNHSIGQGKGVDQVAIIFDRELGKVLRISPDPETVSPWIFPQFRPLASVAT
jgi:hypothetical protein